MFDKTETTSAEDLVKNYLTHPSCKSNSTSTNDSGTSYSGSNNTISGDTSTSSPKHLNIEFRNIQSSSHACFALFRNGHVAGTRHHSDDYGTDSSGVGEYNSSRQRRRRHLTWDGGEYSGTASSDGTGGDRDCELPDSGVVLSSGSPFHFDRDCYDQQTTNFYEYGDPDLTLIAKETNKYAQTYDACKIEFEFRCVPKGDSDDGVTLSSSVSKAEVSFNYVFASEEYYEYVDSTFNDVFGFFLNHENIARLPKDENDSENTTVSIDHVNCNKNTDYYVGNDVNETEGSAPYPHIEADGLTSMLRARGSTVVNEWNTLKVVIADVGDRILDSWVLLEAGSLSCVEQTDSVTSHPTMKVTKEPSKSPSEATPQPTTKRPSKPPTIRPTRRPTKSPTAHPTSHPVYYEVFVSFFIILLILNFLLPCVF